MAKNESENKITVADVVAEAESLLSEKKVSSQSEKDEAAEKLDEVLEGDFEGKKSFGARAKALAEKLKANKKGVIITLAVVGAAAVAVAKFAAKTVVEEVVESASEELTNDEKKSVQDDLDANDNAA